ncbi:hypothetical protein ONZ45_g17500 [Pleurotus djamor]|nr:hypothetical protein ONZ45_g17500 [Pleurotus djamor]
MHEALEEEIQEEEEVVALTTEGIDETRIEEIDQEVQEEGFEGDQYESPGEDEFYDVIVEDEEEMEDERVHTMHERLNAMRTGSRFDVLDVEEVNDEGEEHIHVLTKRVKYEPTNVKYKRPNRDVKAKGCMVALVKIHGTEAVVLFDSGSTADCISPQFASVAKCPYGYLKDTVPIQLGTVGSGSQIQFGTELRIQVGPVDKVEYMDVLNIDRYEAILGTPFMRKYGVVQDFKNNKLTINGVNIPLLDDEEETLEMARRHNIQRQ